MGAAVAAPPRDNSLGHRKRRCTQIKVPSISANLQNRNATTRVPAIYPTSSKSIPLRYNIDTTPLSLKSRSLADHCKTSYLIQHNKYL